MSNFIAPVETDLKYYNHLLNKNGVYLIINQINGKYYFGSARKVRKRCREHFWSLKRGTHQNLYLQHAFSKDPEVFVCRSIVYTENYKIIEQNLLDQYYDNQKQCYNFSKTAEFPTLSESGKKRLIESKKQMHRDRPEIRKNFLISSKSEKTRQIRRETNLKQRQDPEYVKMLTSACREKLKKYYNITLVNENGDELFIGWNLTGFCRDRGLDLGNLSKVIKGKAKTIKGWSIKHV